MALDAAGHQGVAVATVTLDTIAPAAIAVSALTVGAVINGAVTVTGAAGSVEPGAVVTITNWRTGEGVTVLAAADGRFSGTLAAEAGDRLVLVSTDGAGNTSAPTAVTLGPLRSPFVDALWVATSEGLHKLATSDGAPLLQIAEPVGLRAVRVDERQHVVWAYRPGALLAYDFSGTLLRSVALPLPADYSEATPVALAAASHSGSVWVSVGETLQRVDAQGSVRLTAIFPAPIVAVVVDLDRDEIWVGTPGELGAYRETFIPPQRVPVLVPVRTLELAGAGELRALAWEAAARRLWVGLTGGVRVYDDAEGLVAETVLASTTSAISLDGQGGMWVATPTQLLRLGPAGQLHTALDPWPGAGPLIGVAGQARDGSAWVTSATTLTQVHADAQQVTLGVSHRVKLPPGFIT